MKNREAPYNTHTGCDRCGRKGAHDFMGDYLCDDCVGYTESSTVIPKVGLDAHTELAESHEVHVRQVKKLEEELQHYKQLNCDGIDMNDIKGKITTTEIQEDGRLFLAEKLIKWIQETQCEMDLQTKTSKEIAIEYYDDIEK